MQQSIPWDVEVCSVHSVFYHIHETIVETTGKSFVQNEGGYRDGLELQKEKKQGV